MNEATTPRLELVGSRQLPQWMREVNVSFAFTTYQTGKLFLIGLQPEGRLSVFERTFHRCVPLVRCGFGKPIASDGSLAYVTWGGSSALRLRRQAKA